MTPSRPAPSKRLSHSVACFRSRVIGVRWTGGVTPTSSVSSCSRRSCCGLSRSDRPFAARRSKAENEVWCFRGELRPARGGGMEPQLQRVEVEAVRCGDDDLAIDDAARGQARDKGVMQLGKVAIERPQITALNVDIVLRSKDDGAEAIPFGLEEEAPLGRDRIDQFCEHRFDGRREHSPSYPTQPASVSIALLLRYR